MRDHLMGWPAALLPIQPEAYPSHRSPARASVAPTWFADLRLDLTPADTRGHFGEERLREVQRLNNPDAEKVEGDAPAGAKLIGASYIGGLPAATIIGNTISAWDVSAAITARGGLTEADAKADLNGTRRPDNHVEREPAAPKADAEGWIAVTPETLPAYGQRVDWKIGDREPVLDSAARPESAGWQPGGHITHWRPARQAEQQPAEPDGWIPHDGGPFPAGIAGKDIEVRLRDDAIGRSYCGRGTELRWAHDGNGGDIVAYRVIG